MNASDKEYKGFEIIWIKDIPDCSAQGIFLRHKKTGLEIFHLLNEDKENLCAFVFRTPPESSNGVPHIMEHSVLCGSEKYPVKDPFIHLENQSLKTFLNAMTGIDKTLYPVSSVVEEDYFNLFSVYGDSVFFPKLTKEAFCQEGHHLEKNDKGEYLIQGVVYNEMKGVYSGFDSVLGDVVQQSILPGTFYALDSGGDPAVIPELTYEQYLEFHKEHYRPDNCLLFLCGNVPTEKQLDFLQKDLLDRIEQKLDSYPVQKITPLDVIKNAVPQNFTEINRVKAFGPNVLEKDKDENPSVIVSWRLNAIPSVKEYYEAGLISEMIAGHDGSPVSKALIDSGYGVEISDVSGFDSSTKYMYLSYGLNGVKEQNADKVYELILKVVKDLVENGISQDDIDSALMEIEISNKEVRRGSGPFSLTLMRRVTKGWLYGREPDEHLWVQKTFDEIKAEYAKDKTYFQKLLKKYILDNNQCSIAVVTPSPKFSKFYNEKEKQLIEELKKNIDDTEIESQTKKLREFQQKDESEELKCLPSIDVRNIKYDIAQIKTDFSLFEYEKGRTFPLVKSIEDTNGIDYIRILFPFDVLSPEEYNYVPLLASMITDIGWNGLSWDQAAKIVNKHSGSFYCATLTGSNSVTERGKVLAENLKAYNLNGRDWLRLGIKMIHSETASCLDFVSDCILSPDFKDVKRIKVIFDEYLSSFETNVSEAGHIFMTSRASCLKNRSKAADEMMNGLENLYFTRKQKKNIKGLSKKLSEIAAKIFSSGAVVNIICDAKSEKENLVSISEFAKKVQLKTPEKPAVLNTPDALYKKVMLSKKIEKLEYFEKNIQVGFAACCFDSSTYGTKEAVAESLLAHWLSNNLLWEQIRTVCGAYGAYAGIDSVERIYSIITYRDPNPYKSIQVIGDCLKAASEKVFTEDEIKKAITGRFSLELRPRTPKEKGDIGFERLLYCIDQEDVNDRIRMILTITPEDVHQAAVRVYENFKNSSSTAVLCPKTCKNALKIKKMEL